MLIQAMRHCKNFFEISEEEGDFEIFDGTIEVYNKYVVGQHIAITGSILNNGIYRIEAIDNGVLSFVIDPEEYPAWRPFDGTPGSLYHYGDRVTHNGIRWVSRVDNNSWEPGTVGTAVLWERIYDFPEEHILTDEDFSGVIYGLRIPRDFLELVTRMEEWQKNHPNTNLTSESSFGESLSRATDRGGRPMTVFDVFAKELIPFGEMFQRIDL